VRLLFYPLELKENFNFLNIYSWAAKKAARLAGPAAPGSKEVPDGAPDALLGLSLVFTGELSSFSREEATDLAKRFGRQVFVVNHELLPELTCIIAELYYSHPVKLISLS